MLTRREGRQGRGPGPRPVMDERFSRRVRDVVGDRASGWRRETVREPWVV